MHPQCRPELPPPPVRKAVYGRAGVASSQPLASSAGLEILTRGGNAADAAIAIGATLSVTEPCSNGLGGDLIALHHCSKTETITTILGNGASPLALTSTQFGVPPISSTSPHTIVVPGVVAAWIDIKSRFGSQNVSLLDVLQPAIRSAHHGFAVSRTTADYWRRASSVLHASRNGAVLLIRDGDLLRAPRVGEMIRNEDVAQLLRRIGEHGRAAFYEGDTAAAIVREIEMAGGVMSLRDLKCHETKFTNAISTTYRDAMIFEAGAPTQGAVALAVLNVMQKYDGLAEVDWMHVMIEGLRRAFVDAGRICDPQVACGVAEEMTGKAYAERIGGKIDMQKRGCVEQSGEIIDGGTVQFCVVDADGDAMSVVQSNFKGFGTGIVPLGCGFSLNNRGLNFATGGGNVVAGGKKPFHTIIPGLMKRGREVTAFGVMGAFMQPQGHVIVVHGLVDKGLDAQQTLDQARFRVTGRFSCVEPGMERDEVLVETGVDEETRRELIRRGHVVREEQGLYAFGRGCVCVRKENGVVESGVDNRGDGVALAWI